MRVLELFKGTGSVGRVFTANGCDVVSLDVEARFQPDIVANVLRFDYRAAFRPGEFDYVWASPPCTEFSMALPRRRRESPAVGGQPPGPATLRLATALSNELWTLFGTCGHGGGSSRFRATRPRGTGCNPATGLLKHQPQMRGLAFIDVDYCRFSTGGWVATSGPARKPPCNRNWGYRKRTRIWYGSFRCGCLSPPTGNRAQVRHGSSQVACVSENSARTVAGTGATLCHWGTPGALQSAATPSTESRPGFFLRKTHLWVQKGQIRSWLHTGSLRQNPLKRSIVPARLVLYLTGLRILPPD